ncbi:MAG: peptide chain release factor N(5)-glutamine methyltransferase [Bacteroidetes bacterium]|nr:peptide chain release factor N(5)-glutamine methyltransferase [Bacteroidota bacterium]
MTAATYINKGIERLLPLYAKKEAKHLLQMALEHFCGWPSHIFYTDPDRMVPASSILDLQRTLDDLSRARPIQYILGETVFEGCLLKVREGVLIPRCETAELVRWAKEQFEVYKPLRVLDLCTGSGAIAISLAKAFPQAKVWGIDISEEALEIAKENSRINKVAVDFLCADILQPPDLSVLPCPPHSFDLIVSNPPYIGASEKAQMRPNVLDYEPHQALFVPDEDPLLFYRALAEWGRCLLTESGLLMAEINEYHDAEVTMQLKSSGFFPIQLRKDLNGKPRMVAALRSLSKPQNAHPAPCQYLWK